MIIMGILGAGKVEMFMLGSVSHKARHIADYTCVTVKIPSSLKDPSQGEYERLGVAS